MGDGYTKSSMRHLHLRGSGMAHVYSRQSLSNTDDSVRDTVESDTGEDDLIICRLTIQHTHQPNNPHIFAGHCDFRVRQTISNRTAEKMQATSTLAEPTVTETTLLCTTHLALSRPITKVTILCRYLHFVRPNGTSEAFQTRGNREPEQCSPEIER